jgi:hypothetical protein
MGGELRLVSQRGAEVRIPGKTGSFGLRLEELLATAQKEDTSA